MTTSVRHPGGPQFPQVAGTHEVSNKPLLDAALLELDAHKALWVQTSIQERIAILDEIRHDMERVSARWVQASLKAKGLSPAAPEAGDEWAMTAIVFRLIRLLRKSLVDIERDGRPQLPEQPSRRPDGQVVVSVYPDELTDKILFRGFSAEVWIEPGVELDDVLKNQAAIYQDKDHPGKVALVLAAGNVSSLGPTDFLHKLFQEDQVVIVKMNPVNDYLGVLIETGFQALIKRGFLRLVYGGVETAQYLIQHELVEEIHMTGSDRTHDIIVFGPGEEGRQNKANRTPIMTKRFTSELGSITPLIIIPGPWTEDDINYQAHNLANMIMINAGFNCITPRVLIHHAGWSQRRILNKRIADVFEQINTRRAFYPGAAERHAAFIDIHPEAAQFGDRREDRLPWTFIHDVDPSNKDDIAFNTEAFCSIVAETALDAINIYEYIQKAVAFANETLWGTLVASIIVHPETMQNPQVAAEIEQAIADLRYGTVCVNTWGGFAYFVGVTTWGGYPGSSIYDVQSGIGAVNNTFMLPQPQKSVIRAPFKQIPNPASAENTNFHNFAREFLYYEAQPSLLRLAYVAKEALRS